jgi:hypothetical protein
MVEGYHQLVTLLTRLSECSKGALATAKNTYSTIAKIKSRDNRHYNTTIDMFNSISIDLAIARGNKTTLSMWRSANNKSGVDVSKLHRRPYPGFHLVNDDEHDPDRSRSGVVNRDRRVHNGKINDAMYCAPTMAGSMRSYNRSQRMCSEQSQKRTTAWHWCSARTPQDSSSQKHQDNTVLQWTQQQNRA